MPKGLEDAGLVVLDGLGDSLPELLAGLDEVEGGGDGKVGNGGGIRKAELCVLEVDVGENFEGP